MPRRDSSSPSPTPPLPPVRSTTATARPEHAGAEPPTGSLAGRRILVLRPEHQCRATAELLRGRGAVPVAFAAIAIEPPPSADVVTEAIGRLAQYDLVVLTSENGVEALCAALESGPGLGALRLLPIAAIGPGTTRALREHGLEPSIVPERFVAESLVEAIVRALGPALRGARILLARALEAREVLPESLRASGAHVDVVPVYRTVAAPAERAPELRGLLEEGDVAAVLVTSSSTVDSICRLLGADAPAVLGRTCLASIGPVTTDRALKHGLRVDLTAEVSTIEGLVEALGRQLGREHGRETTPSAPLTASNDSPQKK